MATSTQAGALGPRVVLMSSNGTGMGHLTRLLAYAQGLHGCDVRFLSMSGAAPVVARLGHRYEYLPSRQATGMRSSSWRRLFLDRLVEYLRRTRPDVVVFDGTHPYAGMEVAREVVPGSAWVWSRRALWQPGRNVDQLAKEAWFDLVLEPGDLAQGSDRGATVGRDAYRVAPVTLVGAAELQPREQARRELGLPADGPLALVSLGAGNINDTSGDLGAVVTALGSLGVGACVTRAAIAEQADDALDVHHVDDFPVSRRFAAFDLAVSAAGYNSFHENLRLGLPSLFVPNTQTLLDDQQARVDHAVREGWALGAVDLTPRGAEPLLARLLDDGARMARGAQAADPGNGAGDAAALLRRLAGLDDVAAGEGGT
ncbi:UDP-N-acetylglucosamine--LPS N-acetylglucosamine transferase [Janibacter melonis]|uniref:UDP-N-acetylglucosamine--LPS N-acetylglucosamine transferase n=1 Tax=Janibacter melonis TaxID=262209 RepID=A0A176QFB4_9MICO|nr:UDP-N-acetylglucosamine--LPS N-acetylglucosamine transferase [Janibacter melonis]OAB88404.1 UDP-N-acetylglucosamine--LPS N-acetylglucosamine transferase [Janibacter melonis]